MSEDPDRLGEEDLEALLRRLAPNPLDVGLVSELNRERERLAYERELSPVRIQWGRVLPLTLVCTIVMFGFALHRYGDRLRDRAGQPAPDSLATAPTATEPAFPTTDAGPHFVPVSAHGTIVNASSGGVIETEEGPRQRLNVEYRDAFHWHDPDSGTNIRFFRPRTEEIIVPLPTD